MHNNSSYIIFSKVPFTLDRKTHSHPLTSCFCLQWERVRFTVILGSNDSAVVAGIYLLQLVGHANFHPFFRRSSGCWQGQSFPSTSIKAALEHHSVEWKVVKSNHRNTGLRADLCCSLFSGTFVISNRKANLLTVSGKGGSRMFLPVFKNLHIITNYGVKMVEHVNVFNFSEFAASKQCCRSHSRIDVAISSRLPKQT